MNCPFTLYSALVSGVSASAEAATPWTWNGALPVLLIFTPLLPAVAALLLPEARDRLWSVLNLAGAAVTLGLVGIMLLGVYHHRCFAVELPLVPGMPFSLRADPLSTALVTLSAVLWLLTIVYATGYLTNDLHRRRFFGCLSLCVSATMGVALAGDLFTKIIFYEFLTLAAYPLVAHRGTEQALNAGRTYLAYTLGGGALLVVGAVWLYHLTGTLQFTERGFVAAAAGGHRLALTVVFSLLVVGFGVKAALIPLHGWLPVAHPAAPSPASAILSGLLVKVGPFGIFRTVGHTFGIEYTRSMGLLAPLAIAASVTILYASLCALRQDNLKRRLAFSTVGQVSYITLGIAIASPLSTVGGVAHLIHHGVMKITLFFCVGILAETLGIHRVSEMRGVARRMPWTMAAFTLTVLGMIGVPPMAGFVSKWYLGLGGLEAGQVWVIGVLIGSSLLNAAYFLPIIYTAYFRTAAGPWPVDHHPPGRETQWTLLVPTVITAGLSLVTGLWASVTPSPLTWAKLIAVREWSMNVQWQEPITITWMQTLAPANLVWPAVVTLPLLWAAALMYRAWRGMHDRRTAAEAAEAARHPPAGRLVRAAPWTALPALILSLTAADGAMAQFPGLLLGTQLGLDETGRVFLFFTSLVWLVAGLFARDDLAQDPHRPRFFVFFLLAMAGNLGLIVAQDMLAFYLFFALMSFSSYGLIVHNGDEQAVRAARVYMILVVVGEVLFFSALLAIAHAAGSIRFGDLAVPLAGSPHRNVIAGVVLVSLGIKVGMLPLHFYLPLAYSAAPTPASAVLSGAMINAGLIGWLRFLPFGEAALPQWGTALIALGLGAAFFGVTVGVGQRNAKTVLAYSSISQMGLITILVGVGLTAPEAWPQVSIAVLMYAMHHGLAKGMLFLGVGVAELATGGRWQRWLVAAGLFLPALALAGAPLTSGAVAKTMLKPAAAMAPEGWFHTLDVGLLWAAVGTTLLMARFLFLALPRGAQGMRRMPEALWVPWSAMAVLVAAAVFVWPWEGPPRLLRDSLTADRLWTAAWPTIVGAGAALTAWFAVARARRPIGEFIPPGDIVVPLARTVAALRRLGERLAGVFPADGAVAWRQALAARLERWGESSGELEDQLLRSSLLGTLLALLLLVVFLVLFTS